MTSSFASLLKQHAALMTGRWITDLANTSAFLFSEISDINWAGFYLREGEMLYLGPFQGKPACTEIGVGRGVCGTAVQKSETLNVPDVHDFPGHITCDPTSRSEIVVPLVREGAVIGVLDIDSTSRNRFRSNDTEFFEAIAAQLMARASKG